MKNEGIKIKGHRGTWYIIDETVYDGKRLYLLESEIWGDEVASLIVDEDCNVVLDDVWNGFFDYEECMN